MLVGNKSDDETKREVNAKTGEALQVSRVMEVFIIIKRCNFVMPILSWFVISQTINIPKNVIEKKYTQFFDNSARQNLQCYFY